MSNIAYQGLTVLDISQGVAGPYCGTMLALRGARVIKVEPPNGDWIRLMGGGQNGLTALSIVSNLGKRSICVDASKPDGSSLLLRLASQADVFIENFRPGVIAKLGLDYETLKAANPALIYVSISGYGDAGPAVNKPATDSVLQAYSGMTMQNKEENGKPRRMSMLVVDTVAAIYAAECVATALYTRTRTGLGEHIKLSLAQCSAAFQAAPMVDDMLFAGRAKPPVTVPSGVFATADGFISLLTLRESMWVNLCRALGREEWLSDPRFATNELRGEHSAEVNRLVAEILPAKTTKAWTETLERFDVLCGEIKTYAQFRDDPQMKHMHYFDTLEQPPFGPLTVPYLPGMDRSGPLPPAPRAGQHTREVLEEFGYTASDIAAMAQAGIIVQAD